MLKNVLKGVLVAYLAIGAIVSYGAPRVSTYDELSTQAQSRCEPTLTMDLLFWPYTVRYCYGGAFARCVNRR
jgi:hypothetical protein